MQRLSVNKDNGSPRVKVRVKTGNHSAKVHARTIKYCQHSKLQAEIMSPLVKSFIGICMQCEKTKSWWRYQTSSNRNTETLQLIPQHQQHLRSSTNLTESYTETKRRPPLKYASDSSTSRWAYDKNSWRRKSLWDNSYRAQRAYVFKLKRCQRSLNHSRLAKILLAVC